MSAIKKFLIQFLVVSVFIAGVLSLQTSNVGAKGLKPEEKREILIKYKNDQSSETVKNTVKNKHKISKLNLKKKLKRSKVEVLEIGEGDDFNNIVKEFQKNPDVLYAQPNYKLYTSELPEEPRFKEQWGLKNTGQEVSGQVGTQGIDIHVSPVWNSTNGTESVVVGVLDTGVDINHPELKGSIFTNAKETPGNGVDDDKNGYIDDTHGWDFANKDKTVYDGSQLDQHGTHIAGVLAAGINGQGVRGIAPGVKILPLKFINGTTGYTSDAIEAIEYAKEKGASIINCSWGGMEYNQALSDAIKESGIFFVCAAGNAGIDTTAKPVYPACFDLPNILSVAAVDNQGKLAAFSNYGAKIHVAAPGVSILSTFPDKAYGLMSGTSMAAPFASGTAALIKSLDPTISVSALRDRIKSNSTVLESLKGKVASGGLINAFAALTGSKPTEEIEGKQEKSDPKEGSSQNQSAVDSFSVEIPDQLKEQIHYGEKGVSISTGNYSRSDTDMKVSSPGFEIAITRTYNSKDERTQSTMGKGWTFGFEGSIKDEYGVKTVKLTNGSVQTFYTGSDGKYVANDSRSTLAKQPDNTFILTTKDQISYGFSIEGFLTWMKDRNGNTVNIIVDKVGKVQKITDQVGREFIVKYNAQNYIESVTDPVGRTVKYEYTGNNLTKVISPSNAATIYTYDASGYLSGIKDSLLKTLESIEYDHNTGINQHKVKQFTDVYGNVFRFSYDTNVRKTTITDKNNRKISKTYDTYFYTISSDDPEGKTTSINYHMDSNGANKFGEEKIITDRNGGKYQYDRDDRGNILKVTNPDLSFREYKYDEKNNLIYEKDETGKCTYYIYDSEKRNLLKTVQPLNGTDVYSEDTDQSKFAVTAYEYYSDDESETLGYKAKGLMKWMVEPEGGVIKYTYDDYGYVKSETNPENKVTAYTYNKIGWVLSTTTPKGYCTRYTYDQDGLLEKTELDGGEVQRTVYDSEGRKVKEIAPNAYKEELDQTGTHTYDSQNTDTSYTRYAYFDHGKLKSVTDGENNVTNYVGYDDYGNLRSEIKPNGSVYLYEYDVMNRLIRVSFKEKEDTVPELLEEYSYLILPGAKTQKIHTRYLSDTDKAVTVYTYDYAGRLIEQKNPDGAKVKTTYYANGTVKSTTDGNGGTRYFKYDGMNQLTETWSPIDGSNYAYKKIEYDRAGRKIYEKTGKEKTELYVVPEKAGLLWKSFTYDKEGKVLREETSAGGKVEYFYDADGNVEKNEVYMEEGRKNTTEFVYNHLGKVVEKKVHIKAGDLYPTHFDSKNARIVATRYTYDKNGNLLSVTAPDQITTNYTYDNLNRKTGEIKPGTDEYGKIKDIFSKTEYDFEGNPKTVIDEKGNVVFYEYNQRGEKTRERKGIISVSSIDAGFSLMGSWGYSEAEAYRGTKAYSSDFSGDTAVWTPDIPTSGYYKVYIWYPNQTGSTTSAQYTVTYKDGNAMTAVDQTKGGGTWKLLGTYYFEKGNTGNVKLTVTSGKTAADSVMFEPVPAGKNASYEGEPAGKVVAYYYDRGGRKIAEVSPKFYDPKKKLSEMNRTEYVYDSLDRIKAKVEVYRNDPNSTHWIRFVSKAYKYDKNGNMVKELDALGYEAGMGKTMDEKINTGYGTEFTYNLSNKVTAVLDPVSKDRGLKYNMRYEYDGALRKVTETNAKNVVTQYIYDDADNLLKKVAADKKLFENTYYLDGSLKEKKDGNGSVTLYEYNAFGKLCKTIYPGDDSIPSNTVIYQYDVAGNQVYQKDSTGAVTVTAYDNQGRAAAVTKQKEDGTEAIKNLVKYDVIGNKRFVTDGNGNERENRYDETGKLIETLWRVTNVKGMVTQKSVSYKYDDNSNKLAETDWLGNTYEYTYDPLNRLIEKKNPSKAIEQKLEYNNNHLQIKSYDGKYNAAEYFYDKNNRLVATKDPEGHVTRQSYDNVGNVETKSDGKLNKTVYQYDAVNKLIGVINAKNEETQYEYDLNGNLLIQKDAKGNTAIFEYNAMNKPVRRIDHEGRSGEPENYSYASEKVETYTYDGKGNLKTKIDRNGNQTTYVYDVHGRLKSQSVGDILITYTYDGNGNQLMMTDNTGATVRTYDEENRVITKCVPGIGTTIFQYDVTGVIPAEYIQGDYKIPSNYAAEISKDPKGNITAKIFDVNKRLRRVYASGQTNYYEYDENGNKKSIKYGNGSSEEFEYYKDNLLKTLINKDKTGAVLDKYDYAYDAAHNQTMKKEYVGRVAKGETLYTYDRLNRLETVTEPGSAVVTKYTYDAAGNRESETVRLSSGAMTVTDYAYNEQNRLLNTITRANGGVVKTVSYTYDNNGNMVGKQEESSKPATAASKTKFSASIEGQVQVGTQTTSESYEYDGLNRLIKAANANTASSYAYNGDGLRVEKTLDGKVTRYLYEYDQVVLEVDDAGKQLARNIYGTNLLAREVDGKYFNYLYNGHGDVTTLMDKDGQIAACYTYDAFGNMKSTTKYGDLNGDGKIDTNDDNLMKSYLMGAITEFPSVDGKAAADVDGDNDIDSTDQAYISQYILNMIKVFSADTNKDGLINEKNSIGYAGYQYDIETGLYYLNARFYDSKVARFMQEDTYRGKAEDPLSLNLYTYCHNEPVMYTDPTGHLEAGKTISYNPNVYSEDVKKLQEKLGIKADGYFGSQTLNAVNAWKDKNMAGGNKGEYRGVVGETTWKALGLTVSQPSVNSASYWTSTTPKPLTSSTPTNVNSTQLWGVGPSSKGPSSGNTTVSSAVGAVAGKTTGSISPQITNNGSADKMLYDRRSTNPSPQGINKLIDMKASVKFGDTETTHNSKRWSAVHGNVSGNYLNGNVKYKDDIYVGTGQIEAQFETMQDPTGKILKGGLKEEMTIIVAKAGVEGSVLQRSSSVQFGKDDTHNITVGADARVLTAEAYGGVELSTRKAGLRFGAEAALVKGEIPIELNIGPVNFKFVIDYTHGGAGITYEEYVDFQKMRYVSGRNVSVGEGIGYHLELSLR
ncbi:MAG: S8 family serine peptidase [Clostridia bacterium]|nr:S8 family serine peptidase [Clostridia bacterium]